MKKGKSKLTRIRVNPDSIAGSLFLIKRWGFAVFVRVFYISGRR
jgi:hypothetical protein